MTTAIIFLIVGIGINILIAWWEKKDSQTPFKQEWEFDEGVTPADEPRAVELLSAYGKPDAIALNEAFIIPKSIKEVIEKYETLEFDDYTMDYDRREFLRGEEKEEYGKGFYCIGGDGGEIVFYVRKSTDDEKIYAFDMEGSVRPEPYAGNIHRFIVMRFNAWSKVQEQIAHETSKRTTDRPLGRSF